MGTRVILEMGVLYHLDTEGKSGIIDFGWVNIDFMNCCDGKMLDKRSISCKITNIEC